MASSALINRIRGMIEEAEGCNEDEITLETSDLRELLSAYEDARVEIDELNRENGLLSDAVEGIGALAD